MFSRKPHDEPEAESTFQRQVRNIIETQIARYPLLVQLRAIGRQLADERDIWPYLIPLLLIIAVGTYRGERNRIKAQIAALRDRQ
jgi:hypothetical protein